MKFYFFAVKNALLDPEATKDEVTVLEIETKGYKEQKVTVTNNLFYVDFFSLQDPSD